MKDQNKLLKTNCEDGLRFVDQEVDLRLDEQSDEC
jgi:hypothetical protein